MFDIGWPELLLTAIVAVLVIGPKDLPVVMRNVGRMVGGLKRSWTDFQHKIEHAAYVQEVHDAKRAFKDIGKDIGKDDLAEDENDETS